MLKRKLSHPVSKVVEVSDEEYKRLADEASARMRAEARKRVPRKERNKAPVETTLVSDEEYARLARSAQEAMGQSAHPPRKRGSKPITTGLNREDISPDEYRRLSEEMVGRSEQQDQRQERFIGFLKRLFHPISIAIMIFTGICVYFLILHRNIAIF